jgi:hypothetical protein
MNPQVFVDGQPNTPWGCVVLANGVSDDKNNRNSARATCCNAGSEDQIHVYQCPAPSAHMEWHAAMEELQVSCEAQETEPWLFPLMEKCLTAWQEGHLIPPFHGCGLLG